MGHDSSGCGLTVFSNVSLLKLEEYQWYGWQMLPGYVSAAEYDPYFSPIYVEKVEPLKTGKNVLRLHFFNAFYAQGVQGFSLDMRIIRKCPQYLIAAAVTSEAWQSDRTFIVSTMGFEWLQQCCPGLLKECPPEKVSPGQDVYSYLDKVLLSRR